MAKQIELTENHKPIQLGARTSFCLILLLITFAGCRSEKSAPAQQKHPVSKASKPVSDRIISATLRGIDWLDANSFLIIKSSRTESQILKFDIAQQKETMLMTGPPIPGPGIVRVNPVSNSAAIICNISRKVFFFDLRRNKISETDTLGSPASLEWVSNDLLTVTSMDACCPGSLALFQHKQGWTESWNLVGYSLLGYSSSYIARDGQYLVLLGTDTKVEAYEVLWWKVTRAGAHLIKTVTLPERHFGYSGIAGTDKIAYTLEVKGHNTADLVAIGRDSPKITVLSRTLKLSQGYNDLRLSPDRRHLLLVSLKESDASYKVMKLE